MSGRDRESTEPKAASSTRRPASDAAAKAVLVTGASTGIGRRITERLASRGYFVYAGARKEVDLLALDAISGVQPLRLDVTNSADIASARREIERAGRGLYALVNNAGILTSGPIASTSVEELMLTVDVNVCGPWRMVGAFAALIASARGRIVTIGSINGVAVNPDVGAYCMSKHALEAFSDVLAAELAPTGVRVSLVQPGSYRTNIARNLFERTGTGAETLEAVARADDPSAVASAVELALSEPMPKARYLVAPNDAEARFAVESVLQRLVETNDQQDYLFDRNALVEMLDAALLRRQQGRTFSREWPMLDATKT